MENLINQEIIFELSDINKTLVCRDNKSNVLNMPIGDLIYRGEKSCTKKIICID